ncbi:chemotaxis protein CheT [Rhizobium mongolense]|uniref:chemotaxis protein CheT n=1 Tax=Rhizobium mongolense TaxID=57676 RepID=UPI0034A373D5
MTFSGTIEPSPVEALPDILMRIVSELHDVAYLIERIEPQLLEIGGADVLHSPDSMKIMQGIDLAVQKTRGLAEFIDTITGEIPQSWVVDVATALSLVKLAEMQKALGGATRHGHSLPLSKAAGDFDFF